MLARITHGQVPDFKAAAYRHFLSESAVARHGSIPGNSGVHILERVDADEHPFIALTFWRELAAVERFARADMESARYCLEVVDFQRTFEPRVSHNGVVRLADESKQAPK